MARSEQWDMGEVPTDCGPPGTLAEYEARFTFISDIDQGMMATVKLVTDNTGGNEEMAAKVVDLRRLTEEKRALFYSGTVQEIRVLYALQGRNLKSGHDNIIKFYGWYLNPGNTIIQVYERCYDTIADKLFFQTALELSEAEAKPIVKQIASAVNYMHNRNIAHRDLKLDNVLCTHPTEWVPVKVCDFNLAKMKPCGRGATLSPMGSGHGTKHMLDPQRAQRVIGNPREQYGRKCDIYALGIITHELLAVFDPFMDETQCNQRNCAAYDHQIRAFCALRYGLCDQCTNNNLRVRCTKDFDPEDSEIANCSDECKDFVVNLLRRDEETRFSAEQVLQHPWIREPTFGQRIAGRFRQIFGLAVQEPNRNQDYDDDNDDENCSND